MKKFTLLLLIFLSSLLSWSQIPNWNWGYNYESLNNDTRGITTTAPNGDVYLIGNFSSSSITIGTHTLTNTGDANTSEIYIIKYNSLGTILWVKKEGGLKMDLVSSITTDLNGNFYLSGTFVTQITFGTTTLNHSTAGIFLTKYDSSGNVIWSKTTGSISDNCYANKIKTDASGNVYMVGNYRTPTVTFGSVVLTNVNYDVNDGGTSFITKYDTNGNVLWAKGAQRTGASPYPNNMQDLSVDSSGNIFVGGSFSTTTMQFDAITISNPEAPLHTIFMVKYDASGNALWAKVPTAPSPNNYINTVSTDASGNAYFSGGFRGTMTFDAVSVMASSSGSKLFTVKYNSSGVAQWAKTASTSGSSYSNIDSSDVDSSGNLYVTGTFSPNTINFGNGIVATSTGNGGLFVVKYNSSGTPLWIRNAGSLDANSRLSIKCKNENEIYIAGFFYSAAVTFGGLTLNNVNATNNVFIAKLLYVPLSAATFTDANFEAAPNPVEDVLYFSEIDGNYSYSLVDGIGKKIAIGKLNPTTNSISFTDFSAGLYFLEVQNEQGQKIVKRIIKK
ncbi:MAG: T9SS type A sorting domain-containing protein [Bacteroidota bacterium]